MISSAHLIISSYTAGLDHTWGVELYGELLEIGGGKERMTKYFTDVQDQDPFLTIKVVP
jgi:hypothetical protein